MRLNSVPIVWTGVVILVKHIGGRSPAFHLFSPRTKEDDGPRRSSKSGGRSPEEPNCHAMDTETRFLCPSANML